MCGHGLRLFSCSAVASLGGSLVRGQGLRCWVWGRVAGVWGGCALQTAPLASPARGGLSHTLAQPSPAAASQLEESAVAVLTGLPAWSTLVAVASPPCHLARAAAPALVVCPACDGGPWSVALAFCHLVTPLAGVCLGPCSVLVLSAYRTFSYRMQDRLHVLACSCCCFVMPLSRPSVLLRCHLTCLLGTCVLPVRRCQARF